MRRVLSLLLLILLTLTGCFKPTLPGARVHKLTVITGAPTLADLPHYLAQSQGFFAAEHLEVETVKVTSQTEALEQLQQDDNHVLLTTSDILLAEPPVTCFLGLTRHDGTFLLAREPEDGLDWPSLKGKTVLAWPPTSLRGMSQEFLLQRLGFKSQTDLTLAQNVDPLDVAGAYQAGVATFAILAEPEVSRIGHQGHAIPINTTASVVNDYPYSGYFALSSRLEKDGEALQSFTNALYRAQLWLKTHKPAEVAAAVKQYYPDLDKELLTEAIARYQTNQFWSYNPVVPPTYVSKLAEIFHQTERLPATNDLTHYFTNQFAEQALKQVQPPQPQK